MIWGLRVQAQWGFRSSGVEGFRVSRVQDLRFRVGLGFSFCVVGVQIFHGFRNLI